MNNLIELQTKTIAGNTVETVSARELHTFLENGDKFSDWFRDRVNQYGFQEGTDFVGVYQKPVSNHSSTENTEKPSGGRPSLEYYITLDMAKELAMVERNEKGKEARRYFIECERKAKSQPNVPVTGILSAPAADFQALYSMLRAMELDRNAAAIGANGAIIRTSGINLLELTGQTRLLSETQSNWYIPTELGEMLEPTVKPAKVNIRLAAVGLQVKNHATGKWELTEEGQKYGRVTEVTPTHGGKMRPQIVWKKDVLPLVEQPVEGE